MTRGTYVWRDGELVEKRLAGPPHPRGERADHFPTPQVIRDHIDAVKSMADGKTYESKSAMRRAYRDLGFEELGNDAPTSHGPDPEPDPTDTVVEAYKRVRDGYKPPPLETSVLPADCA